MLVRDIDLLGKREFNEVRIMTVKLKWWRCANRIYDRFCNVTGALPYRCDRPSSGLTTAGVALSDGFQIHTLVNFKHRWVRCGGVGLMLFEDLGVLGIKRPSAMVQWQSNEDALNEEMELYFDYVDEVLSGTNVEDVQLGLNLVS